MVKKKEQDPLLPGANLVAYSRDSGGEEQDLSVPQQETEIQKWSNANGFIVTRWFKDIARQGSSVVDRTAFLEMMAWLRSKECDAQGVVTWRFSRISRDLDDSLFYKATIRNLGKRVISIADNVPDTPEGRFIEFALDWSNNRMLIDLSIDVKRALHQLVLQHGGVPGVPPRGFKREPVNLGDYRNGQPHIVHRWVPDPDVVPLVRRAFEMRSAGASLQQINVETHLFGSLNSYQTFFSNKLYIGILEYSGLEIPDYCQAIIDRPTWDAVQARIKQHAGRRNMSAGDPTHPRRANSRFLLSGLAFCARCGTPLFGSSVKGKSGDYYYDRYACSGAVRRRDCGLQPVPARALEQAILAEFRNYILTPDVLASNQAFVLRYQADMNARIKMRAAELRSKLGAVRRRITNYTNAIGEAGHSRALLDKLAAAEAEEAEILGQISAAESQAGQQDLELTPGQILAMSASLLQILDSQNQDRIQALLRGFTSKIVVDREETKVSGMIQYFYPPDDHPPPGDNTMSLSQAPMGAPIRRHTFEHSFTTQVRQYKKRSS